jgi:hypothetical protein
LKSDPDQLVNLASQPEHRHIVVRMSERCDELKGIYKATGRTRSPQHNNQDLRDQRQVIDRRDTLTEGRQE